MTEKEIHHQRYVQRKAAKRRAVRIGKKKEMDRARMNIRKKNKIVAKMRKRKK